MLDVISIGSSTMDFYVETKFPAIPWDTPLGAALAIPFGEKFSCKSSLVTSGGNAVNSAITFKRQGLKVATAIKLGCDIPGEMVWSRLKDEGVKDKFVVWSDKKPTSRSVIMLQKGERSIITHQGSGSHLVPSDLNLNKMKAKWWYVSLSGDSYKRFPQIAKKAYEMGVKIAFNPTGHHLREGKKQLISNLKYIDLLVLNAGEASILTGISFSDEQKVFKAIDKMVHGVVAVTKGSKGSVISDGERIYEAGIIKEKKLIDRTGAGDAYGAGLVAGLIRTKEQCGKFGCDPDNLKYAIRLATANASSVIETVGASENALYKEDFNKNSRYKKLKIDVKKIKK